MSSLRIVRVRASRLLSLPALLLGVALQAGAARAQEVETMTHRVSVHGLDLASMPGQAEMSRRIQRAASIVCSLLYVHAVADGDAEQACRAAATAKANTQMQLMVARAAGAASMRMAASGP